MLLESLTIPLSFNVLFCLQVQQDSPSIIYNTLLELYLHDLAHVDHEQKSTKKELERKAMDLLQTSDVSLIF